MTASRTSARGVQLLLVFLAVAGFSGSYFDADLALKLKCACGCNEAMMVCSHQGCQVAPKMRAEFKILLASGTTQDAILKRMVQDYGDAALADKSAAPVGPIALFVPFAILLLTIPALVIMLRRWKNRSATPSRSST